MWLIAVALKFYDGVCDYIATDIIGLKTQTNICQLAIQLFKYNFGYQIYKISHTCIKLAIMPTLHG